MVSRFISAGTVLQCVAVCCSALQCVAVRCSVSQRVAVCCSALQCVAVCCSELQCVVCVGSSARELRILKSHLDNSINIYRVAKNHRMP